MDESLKVKTNEQICDSERTRFFGKIRRGCPSPIRMGSGNGKGGQVTLRVLLGGV